MASKTFANLVLNIEANSAELTKGLKQANSSIDISGKKASSFGKLLDDTFKNASKSIGQIIPGFSSFTSALGIAAKATNGLTVATNLFSKALISSGIGAIIVAIGVALAALISYFKNTKSGADAFNKAMSGIKAVIDTLMHRFNLLGEAVSLIMQGKFKEAGQKAKEAFSGLKDEIKENYELGRKYAERENALKKKQIDFKRKEVDYELQISEAKLIASDKSKSEVERQQAITTAIKLQKELGAEKAEIAKEEYELQTSINALGDNKYEDDEKEAELYAAMVAAKTEEADRLKELIAMNNEISDAAKRKLEAEQKTLEVLQKELELLKEQNQVRGVGPTGLSVGPNEGKDELRESSIPQLDETKNALEDFANSFSLFDSMSDPFGFLVDSLNHLSGALAEGADSFKEYAKSVGNAIRDIISAYLAEAVASMISNAINAAGWTGALALAAAPALIAAGTGIVKTAFNTLVPEFASGTNYAPGGLALVGERGPELVNLPRGAQVYNNNLTRGMMGGGEVRFIIEQDKLVGILGDYNKKNIYF